MLSLVAAASLLLFSYFFMIIGSLPACNSLVINLFFFSFEILALASFLAFPFSLLICREPEVAVIWWMLLEMSPFFPLSFKSVCLAISIVYSTSIYSLPFCNKTKVYALIRIWYFYHWHCFPFDLILSLNSVISCPIPLVRALYCTALKHVASKAFHTILLPLV